MPKLGKLHQGLDHPLAHLSMDSHENSDEFYSGGLSQGLFVNVSHVPKTHSGHLVGFDWSHFFSTYKKTLNNALPPSFLIWGVSLPENEGIVFVF